MTEPRAPEPPTPADDAPQPGRTARSSGGQDGVPRPPAEAARSRAEGGDARDPAEDDDGLGPGWHPA